MQVTITLGGLMDFTKETDLILDEILYYDFRTEIDTDKAKTIIRRALKKVYKAGQEPPNQVDSVCAYCEDLEGDIWNAVCKHCGRRLPQE